MLFQKHECYMTSCRIHIIGLNYPFLTADYCFQIDSGLLRFGEAFIIILICIAIDSDTCVCILYTSAA